MYAESMTKSWKAQTIARYSFPFRLLFDDFSNFVFSKVHVFVPENCQIIKDFLLRSVTTRKPREKGWENNECKRFAEHAYTASGYKGGARWCDRGKKTRNNGRPAEEKPQEIDRFQSFSSFTHTFNWSAQRKEAEKFSAQTLFKRSVSPAGGKPMILNN